MGDRTHVRISRATKARLEAYIARYEAAVQAGRIEADPREQAETINPLAATLSLDAAICRLLDQVEGHQRRGRTQKRKKPQTEEGATDGN